MPEKEINWDALQRAAMVNLIQDMKEWNDARSKGAISGSANFKNNKLKSLGLDPEKISQMIQNTALDDFGSNTFTIALLELMEILEYDTTDPESVKFFYNQLQEAYYFAFQKDQKRATRIFYDNLKAAAQNSMKIDTIAMPSKTVYRQLNRLKKQQQDLEEENDDSKGDK